MRNLKKVLVLVLTLAMVLGLMVVGAGAAFTDQSSIDTKHKEAVDMAIALNIIEGYPDGSFQPNGNITRAEMSKIICIALNGGEVPTTATKQTPSFTDIQGHWAEGFIEYCYSKGVVDGVGNGQFNPEGQVTGSQAAKMLLVAVGWNADVEQFTGPSWELNTNVQANQDGLYKELTDMDASAPLTREHAAQMIWNALQDVIVNKSSQIDRTTGDVTDVYEKDILNTDMLDKYYSGEVQEAQMLAFDYNSVDKEWTYTIAATLTQPRAFVVSKTDYTSLIGQEVKAVFDNSGTKATKDAYGIFANKSVVLFSGKVGDFPTLKNTDTDLTFDGIKYKFDDYARFAGATNTVGDVPVFVFRDMCDVDYGAATYANTQPGWFTLADLAGKSTALVPTVIDNGANIQMYDSQNFYAVDYDGNNKIDFIMIQPTVIAKVTSVTSEKFHTGIPLYDAEGVIGAKQWTKSDVTMYDGIAKDDYVAITPATNTADNTDVITKLDQISGKVTTKDYPSVTVDGTTYKLDKSFNHYADDGLGNETLYGTAVNAGTILTDAAIYNGFIFDADATGNFNISDYVVILGMDAGAYADTAKLLFSDGTKKVIDLNTDNNIVLTVGFNIELWNGTGTAKIAGVGDICTYETNKDGEYTLAAAIVNPGTGFDYAAKNAQVQAKSGTSNKAYFIDGYTVADDAVIFIKDAGNNYKVINGARLKTMDYRQFGVGGGGYIAGGSCPYVLATDKSSSGLGNVNMAYVVTTEGAVQTTDYQYGYITKVVEAKNADNQDVYTVTMYTKDGSVTLNTTGKNINGAANIATNTAIRYTVDSDNEIDEIYDGQTGTAVDMYAITGKNSDNLWITNVAPYNAGIRTPLDDDCIFLIVDMSEEEGVSVTNKTDVAVADDDGVGGKVQNAIILTVGGDIVFVVTDVDNGNDL